MLHVVPDDVSEGALFRENIRRISGSGLTFDLCTLPHQASRVTALVDLAPDVQFVLDHCGVPDIRSDAFEPWRAGISEIARRPNVVCKISGVIAYADAEDMDGETLQPYIEHVTQVSAGTASSGAATGRSARSVAASYLGCGDPCDAFRCKHR